jgi:hypothetical protein
MNADIGWRERVLSVPKTFAMLALLQATLPIDLALIVAALLRSRVYPPPPVVSVPSPPRRTILLSGGKMTKSLQLARSFHADGHRVVLVESARYRLTGHRFSRAVDVFHVVPDPASPEYVDSLVDIVRREGVDVYVPVCSPASSRYDALAKARLQRYCEVLHGDAEQVATVDDKATFAATAAGLGLGVPDTHRVTTPAQVEAFDFAAHEDPYVLKSIRYDPVNRLDLTQLPLPTPERTAAFARSKTMSAQNPWILQAFVQGQEYCTHGTVRDGHLQVFACCRSSASQLNYTMVDKPEIEAWVTKFVGDLGLTGQYSFDFIETPAGQLSAIECNPRTHSAITMFYDHPGFARAYLETGVPTIRPTGASKPTYWIYDELWRLLTHPGDFRTRLRVIREGKDAVFDPADPMPFFMLHHVHIPSLLVQNLVRLRPWVKIDVNIGKLVEPEGD